MEVVTDGDSMPMLESKQKDGSTRLYRVQHFVDGKWMPVDDDTLRMFAIAMYPPRMSGYSPSPY